MNGRRFRRLTTTVENTREYYSRKSEHFVPKLIKGPWSFLVPKNPVPTNILGRAVDPFVGRVISMFVLIPDSEKGSRGLALVAFRNRHLLARYMALMQEVRFAPWANRSLKIGRSLTFQTDNSLAKKFVDPVWLEDAQSTSTSTAGERGFFTLETEASKDTVVLASRGRDESKTAEELSNTEDERMLPENKAHEDSQDEFLMQQLDNFMKTPDGEPAIVGVMSKKDDEDRFATPAESADEAAPGSEKAAIVGDEGSVPFSPPGKARVDRAVSGGIEDSAEKTVTDPSKCKYANVFLYNGKDLEQIRKFERLSHDFWKEQEEKQQQKKADSVSKKNVQ